MKPKKVKEKFNISFKKEPRPTGLMSVGWFQSSDILVNKKDCGTVTGPSIRMNGTRIQLMVYKNDIMEDGNPNCKWMNISIKHPNNFKDHDEARNFVRENLKEIVSKLPYKIRFVDED